MTHILRKRVFDAFELQGACITPVTSHWRYEIEHCDEFEYVKADCYFFTDKDKVIVDIQHTGGPFCVAKINAACENCTCMAEALLPFKTTSNAKIFTMNLT